MNKCVKDMLRLSSKIKGLSSIARSIEEGEGITEWGQIAGPAKCPRLVRANSPTRRLFCQLAVGKMGYPGAEVARFLGVTTSAVVRAAKMKSSKKFKNTCKFIQA